MMRTALILLSLATLCYTLPLSTDSRWIIDDPTGGRVKLACVNWPSHVEPMLAEGLDKRPVADIARHIREMGFNCARFTYAIYMFTRYANVTVAENFQKLGLTEALKGLATYNPEFLHLSLVDAHRRVVNILGQSGVMAVVDNHVSRPSWCCGNDDGNGFFGDKYFNPQEWLQGLTIAAHRYKYNPMVVGMSMRNELRGPRQNQTTWYKYIEKGARTIHSINPRALVIVSGLNYDINLSFLKEKPLNLGFMKNKLVYEFHRYAFSEGQRKLWSNNPFSKSCGQVIAEIEKKAGFLSDGDNAAPLFVSEFGVKQNGMGEAERLFLGCFLGYLAEKDYDFAYWALQGSYYLRHGKQGDDETYGLLDQNWTHVRNPELLQKLRLIQRPLQGPQCNMLYHPWSSKCMTPVGLEVFLSDCPTISKWSFPGNGNPVRLMKTGLCLSAIEDGAPAVLTRDCSKKQSQWERISDSSFQLATRDESGNRLCLEVDEDDRFKVFTKKCQCVDDDDYDLHDCKERPHGQWFKLIPTS